MIGVIMNILGVSCSPRKGGNCEILVREAMSGIKDAVTKTELLTIWDKNIKPCTGCFSCLDTGKCRIKDDMAEIHLKFMEADGIIFGTPVYFFSAAAQAKILIDRSFSLGNKLTNKVGGVISVASSIGNSQVWQQFNAFFSVKHMFAADFVYGFAREKGDIRKDKHAMKAAMELGKQIVSMINCRLKYPKEYDIPIYRFVKREYDIDMSPCMGRFDE
jgi:multimeric flavodoxin WrbA